MQSFVNTSLCIRQGFSSAEANSGNKVKAITIKPCPSIRGKVNPKSIKNREIVGKVYNFN